MKLGELIVELSTKGNTKELEKTLNQLKAAEKKIAAQIKLNKDLAKATTEEEKSLIREQYALKGEIASVEKSINANKERNKTITDSIKGFTRLIGVISLAIGVLDRFANASAKTNQNILTLSQTSGVDVDTINKYASAAKSLNYNVSREEVAQSFKTISDFLQNRRSGADVTQFLSQATYWLRRGGASQESLRGLYELETDSAKYFEKIRRAIRESNEYEASRALEAMSLSTNLLPMFQMSSDEFNKVKNRFLSESQMREEQKRSLELQEKRDEILKNLEQAMITLYPTLNEISKSLIDIAPTLVSIVNDIAPLLTDIVKLLKPLFDLLGNVYKWLKTPLNRKDIEFAEKAGEKFRNSSTVKKIKKEAAFNISKNILDSFPIIGSISAANNGLLSNATQDAIKINPLRNNNLNVNNTYYNTVNTTQPADEAVIDRMNKNQFQNQLGQANRQIISQGKAK